MTRRMVINGELTIDPRSTRAWRRLRDQVLREEPLCWLSLDGCTQLSTTGDHVIPVSVRPDLALVRSNVRGACRLCNDTRKARPVNSDSSPVIDDGEPSALDIFKARPRPPEKSRHSAR